MTADGDFRPSANALLRAQTLALDHLAREVVSTLGEDGIRAILLKGASIARWLYPDDDDPRAYGDVDVLIGPADEARAGRCLQRMGFEPLPGAGVLDPGVADTHEWSRDGAALDLHVSLLGVEAEPASVWRELSAHTAQLEIGGSPVDVLDESALAFHVALHAAQHGRNEPGPLRDLDRALSRAPDETWERAAGIARRLDAEGAFTAGLALHPLGEELMVRLGLDAAPSVTVDLRAQDASPISLGLERLAQQPDRRSRMRAVGRVAFPTPTFLRWWTPVASRGRLGLALAYAWRYAWLAGNGPRAWVTWRAARRRATGR